MTRDSTSQGGFFQRRTGTHAVYLSNYIYLFVDSFISCCNYASIQLFMMFLFDFPVLDLFLNFRHFCLFSYFICFVLSFIYSFSQSVIQSFSHSVIIYSFIYLFISCFIFYFALSFFISVVFQLVVHAFDICQSFFNYFCLSLYLAVFRLSFFLSFFLVFSLSLSLSVVPSLLLRRSSLHSRRMTSTRGGAKSARSFRPPPVHRGKTARPTIARLRVRKGRLAGAWVVRAQVSTSPAVLRVPR